jgi:hypothetical protein
MSEAVQGFVRDEDEYGLICGAADLGSIQDPGRGFMNV